MKNMNKSSLIRYCVNVSEDSPISIKKNFLDLEKAEHEMFDMYETVVVIAKSIYIYIESQQKIKEKEKVPYILEFYETMRLLCDSYKQSSLIGYVLNILSEMGFVQCDLLNHQLISLEESIFNPCQNIIKSYPILNKFRYIISTNYATMESIKNKIKSGSKVEGERNSNNPQMVLHKLGMKFEENQKQVIKSFKNFIIKEQLTIKKIVNLLEIKAEYFNLCASELDNAIETIKSRLSGSYRLPVFGTSLSEHLEASNLEISVVIHDSIAWILNNGIEEQGIFRLPGNKFKVNKLAAAFDADIKITDEYIPNIHVMCAVLKQYLRCLPQSLIFKECSADQIKDTFNLGKLEQTGKLKAIVDSLPRDYYANLRYFFRFLKEVTKHQQKNLMGAQNIGVVFGPSMINGIDLSDEEMINLSMSSASIVTRLIENYDTFFPEPCQLMSDKYLRINCKSDKAKVANHETTSELSTEEQSEVEEDENSFKMPFYFSNPRAYELLSFGKLDF